MAKRSEIFKALKANGWEYLEPGEAFLVFKKGTVEAELYTDTLNFNIGFVLNSGDDYEHGLYIAYWISDITVRDGKLVLPEHGFCPYCG